MDVFAFFLLFLRTHSFFLFLTNLFLHFTVFFVTFFGGEGGGVAAMLPGPLNVALDGGP